MSITSSRETTTRRERSNDNETSIEHFPDVEQFASELDYFSDYEIELISKVEKASSKELYKIETKEGETLLLARYSELYKQFGENYIAKTEDIRGSDSNIKIPEIIDFQKQENQCIVLFEYLEGKDLIEERDSIYKRTEVSNHKERLAEFESKIWPKIKEAGCQLEELHELGLVFGDFKLDNIFLNEDGVYFIDLDTVAQIGDESDLKIISTLAEVNTNLEPGIFTWEYNQRVQNLSRCFNLLEKIKNCHLLEKYGDMKELFESLEEIIRENFGEEYLSLLNELKENVGEDSNKDEVELEEYIFESKKNELKRKVFSGIDPKQDDKKSLYNISERDIRSLSISIFDSINELIGGETFRPAIGIDKFDFKNSFTEKFNPKTVFGARKKELQEIVFGLLNEHAEVPKDILKSLFIDEEVEKVQEVRPSIPELIDVYDIWIEELLNEDEKLDRFKQNLTYLNNFSDDFSGNLDQDITIQNNEYSIKELKRLGDGIINKN
jgi:serine/threonine protein kinase